MTFKVNFLPQILSKSFSFFSIEEYQFRRTFFGTYWHFLIISVFESLICDTYPLTQFSKFNNFLWVCWLLCKNLSDLVPPFENSTTRTAIVHVQCIQLMTLAYSQKYLFLDIIGLLPEMKPLTDMFTLIFTLTRS